jgi:hypothetical protein
MVVKFGYFRVLMFNILSTSVKRDYITRLVTGSTLFCIERRPQDGTLMLKHVRVFITPYEFTLSNACIG